MSNEAVLYWLAGLLEGEGTFLHGPPSSPTVPVIRVEMTDLDVIERIGAIFARTVQRHRPREAHYKPSYSTTLKGASAVHFMRLLRPVLGVRRQEQIDAAMSGAPGITARWLRNGATCTAIGCERPGSKRGICKRHYDAWWKARKGGRTSLITPHDPLLPTAVLVEPTEGHPGAMPWLAGLLEGEGSFLNKGGYPAITVNMCDRDVIARVAALLDVGPAAVRERFDLRDQLRGWKRSYLTSVAGARAAELMRTLRPLMGDRRGGAIDHALEAYSPVRLTHPPDRCTFMGCVRTHRSRGLCNAHYMMWSRDRVSRREARITPLR